MSALCEAQVEVRVLNTSNKLLWINSQHGTMAAFLPSLLMKERVPRWPITLWNSSNWRELSCHDVIKCFVSRKWNLEQWL